ncbi:hypothetical protein K435DRAFT_312885 [Dendrothele bispora CBS 962.96]|uniref:Uncharacterized protein n=1 Tax=Dendrothele bispora (strain CBS 962.96) TaxID=1314807 RepID=A0A4S8LHC6_DENBC|nr:hypothetical protein K435DRAFT_312885 [Dendrothele bispora CBS 962.96]
MWRFAHSFGVFVRFVYDKVSLAPKSSLIRSLATTATTSRPLVIVSGDRWLQSLRSTATSLVLQALAYFSAVLCGSLFHGQIDDAPGLPILA